MKTLADFTPNDSWFDGFYFGGKAEIKTNIPYISVDPDLCSSNFSEGFFVQGHEAEEFIKEMHEQWLKHDKTTEEIFKNWINTYL